MNHELYTYSNILNTNDTTRKRKNSLLVSKIGEDSIITKGYEIKDEEDESNNKIERKSNWVTALLKEKLNSKNNKNFEKTKKYNEILVKIRKHDIVKKESDIKSINDQYYNRKSDKNLYNLVKLRINNDKSTLLLDNK